MWAKRIFDFAMAWLLLVAFLPALLLFWLLAALDTRSSGIFLQTRIGQHGKPFTIFKLRTMRGKHISAIGRFLRKSKADEAPQLLNVLLGDMSFVGPRPDVPGYYDKLLGNDRRVLQLKPGITSEAAIYYRDEERLLAAQPDALRYNDEVLFPDKVRRNLEYWQHRSFWKDLQILGKTFASYFPTKNTTS